MSGALTWKDEPAWLSKLTAESIEAGRLPLRDILRGALYYPASSFDWDPVKYLAGHIHSFVYVDFAHAEEDFENALRSPGFHGYRILGKRSVVERELLPRGWNAEPADQRDRMPPDWRDAHPKPFCTWVVLEHREEEECLGPSRFSLLYWSHDGVDAFRKLYEARGLAPRAVAIIQPGHGFGGNWTDFNDPRGPLAQAVLTNAAGLSKLLLCGGDHVSVDELAPCWPGYEDFLGPYPKAGGGHVGIWKRTTRRAGISTLEEKA